ncbi:hypothetical protein SDRG_03119 [Saprolegnia diclina VS20]|uniref:FHA domain-containing protein n=1 Tax=Saprolegnia diclina (strain VS20) TaxID=1156394 RepID=T0QYC7_SAPDV|nr:hypothetical protein SDRG_03119 [Saprolegnia diclina VS20]EQC39691.1 hypothetical protein SDRG_03119 [Saprolegnia diclina VS20]|eukprot:XP_008606963.1 hypothetical protein SDRG_03119 [Saprolegnia diclina VS20]
MTETTTTTCGCLASLEVLMGPHTGAMVAPTSSAIAIGRSKKFVGDTGLLLASDFDVSSRHASIAHDASLGRFVVIDVGSTNGTKINEKPIPPRTPTPLRDGDTLTTGASLLAFRIDVVCAVCAAPKPREPDIVAAEGPIEHEECVVCRGSLYGLSFEERHLHVNACLDSQPKAKKAKKQKSINQEQVEFALALSKSLVDDELEATVNKTLLTRDLAAIDAQIATLQKQRAKILKQLQKSEKQSKRVAKSRVLPPDAVRTALHDVASYEARVFLFPQALALPSRRPPCVQWRPRDASDSLIWWSKAAQGDQWAADDYLVPNVLPTATPFEAPEALSMTATTSPSETTTTLDLNEPMAALVSSSPKADAATPLDATISVASLLESPPSPHQPQASPAEPETKLVAPSDIASIFPTWQDDVAFIDAQTDASALRDALQALAETQAVTTDPSTIAALAFFATHMEARLLQFSPI